MSATLRACFVLLFLLVAACGACAQESRAASAVLTGQVSGVVSLSASEAREVGGRAQISIAEIDAATVAVSISSGGDAARVRLPVRLRSNVGYRLCASLLSPSELSVRLSAADFRATGALVRAGALEGVRLGDALAAPHDKATTNADKLTSNAAAGRVSPPAVERALPLTAEPTSLATVESGALATLRNRPLSVTLLEGPAVSKGGTFESPANALEIVLTVELRPRQGGEPWSAQLTISAAPAR